MTAILTLLLLQRPKIDLSSMEGEIAQGKFAMTTSVLVHHHGKLVYEKYFGTGRASLLNDTRSVTKTVTSLIAGIAGQKSKSRIESVVVRNVLGAQKKDSAWDGTTLKDLMTMSSPLAADDSDSESPGNEDRMHEKDNWLPWILQLPTKSNVERSRDGQYPFCYATVNAVLAGQVVQKLVGQKLDKYIRAELFGPLGIKKAAYQYSKSGEVMSGGGLRLTSRDLAKLGQLILNKGSFAGKQIVPPEWIEAMTTAHRTDTVMPGVDYGYFLWKIDFGGAQGQNVAWCMLGNGGNLVAVLPKRDAVVTITRVDYNSASTPAETMDIMGRLILPQLN